jgi:hypothetical protein
VSSPDITAWSGFDLRGGATPELATDAFAQSSPESGAGRRYELLAVAARGFRPPRFLSITDVPGDQHADPTADSSGSYEGLRQTWSLLYRQTAGTAPASGAPAPFGIYLLGVNPPPGASDSDIETFNDFYTNVHLPEVAERRHALSAARYELFREIRPPYQGAPRYLATYAVDEEGANNRRHSGPAYSVGPDVWQRHTTPWRLWYRRLGR